MGTPENNKVTIVKFFSGQRVVYNAQRGDIAADLILQERKWQVSWVANLMR